MASVSLQRMEENVSKGCFLASDSPVLFPLKHSSDLQHLQRNVWNLKFYPLFFCLEVAAFNLNVEFIFCMQVLEP